MTSWTGAALAVPVCLAATPYLAGLTVTVPDRDNARWHRPPRVSAGRTALTGLVAGVCGLLAGAAAGLSALLPAFLALALLAAPLVVIDFEHHRLPNRLVLAAAGAALVLLYVAASLRAEWPDYLRGLEGGALVYALLFVIMFLSPPSFGWGDVKLGGVLGLYLGYDGWTSVLYGIFAGFVLGTVVAVALMATGRATRKTPIAFGPMLVLGTLLVLALDISS